MVVRLGECDGEELFALQGSGVVYRMDGRRGFLFEGACNQANGRGFQVRHQKRWLRSVSAVHLF